jgi:hypothetical protein
MGQARVGDISINQAFEIRDLIDGERRISYYRRVAGEPRGRFVPTILYGFRQYDRHGLLRVERLDLTSISVGYTHCMAMAHEGE